MREYKKFFFIFSCLPSFFFQFDSSLFFSSIHFSKTISTNSNFRLFSFKKIKINKKKNVFQF